MEDKVRSKILIIEDEALVARELKSRLTNMGCEVVGIAYGREGIALARETKPDLLLSDIHLKDGQDGIDMARIIQAERDVPVVFLTAYSDEDTVGRAKELTPYGYIIKPVENRELRIAIDMALYKFQIEKELKETQQLLQNALTCIGNALVFLNEHGDITNLNADAEQILGRARSEVLGSSWQEILSVTGSSIQDKISQALASKEVVKLAPFILGSTHSWLIDGVVGPMEKGSVLILRALTEITDAIEVLPAAEELMLQLGAESLRPLESSMCQLLIASRAERELSEDVTDLLNQLLRSTDLISNYAESQLSVSMPYTSVDEGMLIARSLLRALQENFSPNEWEFSIGLAYSLPGDQQPFEMFRQASLALKIAKDAGGNRVIKWNDEIDQSALRASNEAEKQREYHNQILLWNVLNVVAKANDVKSVSEKLCHHLIQSFDFELAAILENSGGYIHALAGANHEASFDGIEAFNFSAQQFSSLQNVFKSDKTIGLDQSLYFFPLSADKVLAIKTVLEIQSADIEFLKILLSYFATGLNRFDIQKEDIGSEGEGEFVFQSDVMKAIEENVLLVAPTDATVLISGESGTGKEVVARAIHAASDRSESPFIIVDCGAVVSSLIESELFGHVKGAFTGADKNFAGRLRQAEGGTVLLDEIGELPLDIQVKLLRFVQNREIASVGSNRYESVNTRVIAASHRDLSALVEQGEFREDLYYRLNVFSIECPALRRRGSDVYLLAKHYLKKFAKQYDKDITGITSEAEHAIYQYDWPGNIRELMNVINRAVILCKDKQLNTIHIGLFPKSETNPQDRKEENSLSLWLKEIVDEYTKDESTFPAIGQWLEEDLILKSLSINSEVLNRAALNLGIPESTLRRKVGRLKEGKLSLRPASWDSNHHMIAETLDAAEKNNKPVFDLITDGLVKVLETKNINKKDAASLMGVSLPTYRRLLADSS